MLLRIRFHFCSLDWSNGDEFALEQLMPLVYDELPQMARRYMRRQPSGGTFQTTELIHEAYLKIAKQDNRNWQNRAHFSALRHRRCGGIFWLITRVPKTVKSAAVRHRKLVSKKVWSLRRIVRKKSSRSTML